MVKELNNVNCIKESDFVNLEQIGEQIQHFPRMSRNRHSGVTLQMDCWDEELSPEQKNFYGKANDEYNNFKTKLQKLAQTKEVTFEEGQFVSFFEFFSNSNGSCDNSVTPVSTSQATNNAIIPQASTSQAFTQLVVPLSLHDERLGVLVGQGSGGACSVSSQPSKTGTVRVNARHMIGPSSVLRGGPSNFNSSATSSGGVSSTGSRVYKTLKTVGQPQSHTEGQPPQRKNSYILQRTPCLIRTSLGEVPGSSLKNAQGNQGRGRVLSPISQTQEVNEAVVDLTEEETGNTNGEGRMKAGSGSNGGVGSSRVGGGKGVNSNDSQTKKTNGKTFPSLVVVARPNLSSKEYPAALASKERQELDLRVKKVLMQSSSGFTEYLLQNGLLKCEQTCPIHTYPDGSSVKLKLGMYSDTTKFPHSGGYIWISECCQSQFVSVFNGSLFDSSPHPPSTILKLLYHWACHTSIQNVVQWVKVDNVFVKSFYTYLRAVCTAAVHQKYTKMGGRNRLIQMGVISLGTTTQDGQMRQVKVEVIGVLDPETKLIRIRAIEPVQESEKNYKKRFMKILEPLIPWVDKESTILTDFTVDRGTLTKMGYNNVYQVPANELSSNNQFSNYLIMDYLRKIVPRMFQNTLSLLSRGIIQQFLDELVWRERWGPIPSKAFNSIIEHIAEQTKLDSGGTYLNRLAKISANPFKNWRYDRWAANCKPQVPQVTIPSKSIGGLESLYDGENMMGVSGVGVVPIIKDPPASQHSRVDGAIEASGISSPVETSSKVAASPVLSSSSGDVGEGAALKGIKTHSMSGSSLVTMSTHIPSYSSSLVIDHSTKENQLPPLPSIDNLPPTITQVESNGKGRESRGESKKLQAATILLDPYYYGTYPGDPSKQNTVQDFNVTCPLCEHQFSNNVTFMDHIIQHSLNKTVKRGGEMKDICRLCCKVCPSQASLKVHHLQVHKEGAKGGSGPLIQASCKICSVKMRDKGTLIAHMAKTHFELEMPYICKVCNFRTSIWESMVKHFYDVHKDGNWGICPYCFRIFIFTWKNGHLIERNVFFFMNHIQRHQLSSLVRKCTRCYLWFLNKSLQEEHEMSAHKSCKNLEGVVRLETEHPFTMPAPLKDPVPSSSFISKVGGYGGRAGISYNQLIGGSKHNISSSLTSPRIPIYALGMECAECEAPIQPDHFPGKLSCTRCSYMTYCLRAMAEHNSSTHMVWSPKFLKGRPIALKKKLYCSQCNYSTMDNTIMATHLAMECTAAYCKIGENKAIVENDKINDRKEGEEDANSVDSSELVIGEQKRRDRGGPLCNKRKRKRVFEDDEEVEVMDIEEKRYAGSTTGDSSSSFMKDEFVIDECEDGRNTGRRGRGEDEEETSSTSSNSRLTNASSPHSFIDIRTRGYKRRE